MWKWRNFSLTFRFGITKIRVYLSLISILVKWKILEKWCQFDSFIYIFSVLSMKIYVYGNIISMMLKCFQPFCVSAEHKKRNAFTDEMMSHSKKMNLLTHEIKIPHYDCYKKMFSFLSFITQFPTFRFK